METKKPGDSIYVIGNTFGELGGSEYYKLNGFVGNTVPRVRGQQARRTFSAVTKSIDLGLVTACHDISEGGLAVAAAEMTLAGRYGMDLDLRHLLNKGLSRNDFALFAESNSRFIVEVPDKAKESFESLMKGKTCSEIGRVTEEQSLSIKGLDGKSAIDASISDLRKSWKATLSGGE